MVKKGEGEVPFKFPKFQLIPILHFPSSYDMHDYVYFIAPIDYCVK